MSLVITTVVLSDIAALRARAVESEGAVYGARREYARGINGLSQSPWYRDGVTLPPAIVEEKKEYYKALKAIGYSNPSNAWKMVKMYALEAARAEGLFGEVVETETETETEGETRETRSLTLRMVEELSKLHKAAMKTRDNRPEEYSEKVRVCHGCIINALKAMGVDIGI